MTKSNSGKGNNYVLIGATSWGQLLCTSGNYPGVYTRITTMMDWIKRTTEKDWNTCESG